MPVLTDLAQRLDADADWRAAFEAQRIRADVVAGAICIVHVSGVGEDGHGVPFDRLVTEPPYELPTSGHAEYCSDATRRAEDLLDLGRSLYFYAGRALPEFGDVALAFAPACEIHHAGSATPFDTGGLMREHPFRVMHLALNPTDGQAERVVYGKASVFQLAEWRLAFGQVLAAYFRRLEDYWLTRPHWVDPERLYVLNSHWRAWAFEVRFAVPQAIDGCIAWCMKKDMWSRLQRVQADQPAGPQTPLDRLLQEREQVGPPQGTSHWCEEIETWVRTEVGL